MHEINGHSPFDVPDSLGQMNEGVFNHPVHLSRPYTGEGSLSSTTFVNYPGYTLEAYKKAMRKRKVWIEPLFGEAKQWHGMERMMLRMLERVNCEALIAGGGQNIKRLLTFGSRGPRRSAQAAALRPPERPLLYLGRRRYGDRRCHVHGTMAYFNTLREFCTVSVPKMADFLIRVVSGKSFSTQFWSNSWCWSSKPTKTLHGNYVIIRVLRTVLGVPGQFE
jgi:hypothetical protein